MIQLTAHMRIFVAKHPVDFRKGIDGLSAVCTQVLKQDVYAGGVFVFRARNRHAVRILVYDGQGMWLITKRLSKGRFPDWQDFDEGAAHKLVQAHNLQLLLAGGQWEKVPPAKTWRPLTT
jgi:transposase